MEGKVFNNLNETKLPTYWSTPLSEICLVKIGVVVYPSMVISDYQAPSLYHLIADGKKRPTNVTVISGWLDWASVPATNTPQDCVEQGFNIGGNMSGDSRARLGVLLSNEADGCRQATHWAGVGVDDIDEGSGDNPLRVSAGSFKDGYRSFRVIILVR